MNRTIPFTFAIFSVMLSASFLASPSAFAQQPGKADTPPAGTKTAPPAADPNSVRRDIYDLGLLHAMQSVNLSQKQIDTITPVLKEVFEADKARKQKDDEALRDIAADVKKARTEGLDGMVIPKDLETRVIELKKGIASRSLTAVNEAVSKVLTALWPTLTDDQKSEMEVQSREFYGGRRVPAAYQKNPTKAPKEEVQKLAVGAFVENVLLDERGPVLLASLKPLKTEGSSSSETTAKP